MKKQCSSPLTLARRTVLRTYANSAAPDQTPQNAEYDQGLHCWPTGISMHNAIEIVLRKPLKTYGLIQVMRMVKSTSQELFFLHTG